MKDLRITVRRQKTELLSLLVCLIVAVLTNVHAIVKYDGQWSELYTSAGFTVVFALVLYAVWIVLRLIIWLIVRMVHRK